MFAWRKSTRFLGGLINLEGLNQFRCLRVKRGRCLRTGGKHIELAGKAPCGKFWTQIAEPYPKKLCKELAQCFLNYELQKLARNFEKYMNS